MSPAPAAAAPLAPAPTAAPPAPAPAPEAREPEALPSPAPAPAPAKLEPSGDHDGDGVENQHDAFPLDEKEHKDSDLDGLGDNADHDRDGDGVNNTKDMYPDDPTKWKDDRAKRQPDRDGDGVPDKEDAFPDDPSEWKDSDGDGVGDNADAFPFNKDCHSRDEPCYSYNKVRKPLPPQGYDEYHPGKGVEHGDDTVTGDWHKEWPWEEKAQEVVDRICKKHPDNPWCKERHSQSAK
uniref:Uncharacterized protein n=1 Tax=Alexandrium catenella TaxID=2925 RepID=A0A7S1S4C8_ALECA